MKLLCSHQAAIERYENDAENSLDTCWLMASRTVAVMVGTPAAHFYAGCRIDSPMSSTRSRLFLSMVLTSAAVASVVTVAQRGRQTRPAPRRRRAPAPRLSPQSAMAAGGRRLGGRHDIRHALQDLRALMKSPAAAEYFERVALLTGELYVVHGAHDRRPQSERSRATVRSRATRPARRHARDAVVRMAPSPDRGRGSADDDRRVRSQRTPPGVAARDGRATDPAADGDRGARSDQRERAGLARTRLQKSGSHVVGRRPERDLRRRTAADADAQRHLQRAPGQRARGADRPAWIQVRAASSIRAA